MKDYNHLQIIYIKSFAYMMHIDNMDEAVLEWVRLGLANKFCEIFRKRFIMDPR